MKKDFLYLASESKPRQRLLNEVGIEFKILKHNSQECDVNLKQSFEDYVLDIAKEKMKHVVCPKGNEDEIIFVLTADTLVKLPKTNHIFGKPGTIEKAKEVLAMVAKENVEVVTGCCLEKKIFKDGSWKNEEKNHWTTKSIIEFCVTEEDFDIYFQNLPQAIYSASGGIIEGFGQRYFKSIKGSYTNVIGLPIFELVQVLKQIQFNL